VAPTAKGFKQEGFAEACDLHRTHVSLLERDRIDITVSTARQIAPRPRNQPRGIVPGAGLQGALRRPL